MGLDVGRALRHCDSLARSNFVASCHEGVFMEAITSALPLREEHGPHSHGPENHADAGRITIDPDDP